MCSGGEGWGLEVRGLVSRLGSQCLASAGAMLIAAGVAVLMLRGWPVPLFSL